MEKYRPFRFPGDATVHGALPSGDFRDLNVITRTGIFKGFTSIIELRRKHTHSILKGQLGILLQGQATVTVTVTVTGHAEELETLSQYDAEWDRTMKPQRS